MNRVVRVLRGAFALLALSGWGRPAAACGACICDSASEAPNYLNPIRDLPLNLTIPIRRWDADTAPPRLERVSDGMVVATKLGRTAAGPWLLIVDGFLEPNTEYRLVAERDGAQFTTGTQVDLEPPTLQAVKCTSGGNGGLCVQSVGAQLQLEGASDGASFAVWVELAIDMNGTTHPFFTSYQNGRISLGHSPMGCFGANELPELEDGASYPSRVRLVDAAANKSQWQAFTLSVAAEEPGGCGEPTTVAGTDSLGGTDATSAGGTGAATANGGTSSAPEDDASRTSKGCSCSLGQRERRSFAGAGLLACVLAAVALRRQLRL